MALRPEDLPRDPALLIELAFAQDDEIASLRATVTTLKSLIFGPRSERMTAIGCEQLALDLAHETGAPPPANDDDAPQSGQAPRKARRNIGALPAHLPRCDRVIEPATTICPCCAGQMHRIECRSAGIEL